MKTQLSAYGYPYVIGFRFEFFSQIFFCKLILNDEDSNVAAYTLYIFNEKLPPRTFPDIVYALPGRDLVKRLRRYVKILVLNHYSVISQHV